MIYGNKKSAIFRRINSAASAKFFNVIANQIYGLVVVREACDVVFRSVSDRFRERFLVHPAFVHHQLALVEVRGDGRDLVIVRMTFLSDMEGFGQNRFVRLEYHDQFVAFGAHRDFRILIVQQDRIFDCSSHIRETLINSTEL